MLPLGEQHQPQWPPPSSAGLLTSPQVAGPAVSAPWGWRPAAVARLPLVRPSDLLARRRMPAACSRSEGTPSFTSVFPWPQLPPRRCVCVCVCFPFPTQRTLMERVRWAGPWVGGSDHQGSEEQSVCSAETTATFKQHRRKAFPTSSGASPGLRLCSPSSRFLPLPWHQEPSWGDVWGRLLFSSCASSC